MSKTTSKPPTPAPRSATRDESTLEKIRQQRLIKFTRQNEKLKIELQRLKKTHVDLEAIKREVIAANQTVKQQVLAVPIREASKLELTRDQVKGLHQALVECLNELAYERQPGTAKRAVKP